MSTLQGCRVEAGRSRMEHVVVVVADHVVAVAYFEVDCSEIAQIQFPATFLETLLP